MKNVRVFRHSLKETLKHSSCCLFLNLSFTIFVLCHPFQQLNFNVNRTSLQGWLEQSVSPPSYFIPSPFNILFHIFHYLPNLSSIHHIVSTALNTTLKSNQLLTYHVCNVLLQLQDLVKPVLQGTHTFKLNEIYLNEVWNYYLINSTTLVHCLSDSSLPES